jgi:hypothetical protein
LFFILKKGEEYVRCLWLILPPLGGEGMSTSASEGENLKKEIKCSDNGNM